MNAYRDGRWRRRGGGGRAPRCGNSKDGKRKERSELRDVANHCEVVVSSCRKLEFSEQI